MWTGSQCAADKSGYWKQQREPIHQINPDFPVDASALEEKSTLKHFDSKDEQSFCWGLSRFESECHESSVFA